MNLLSLHQWSGMSDKIHRDYEEDKIYYNQLPGICRDVFLQLIQGKIYESDSEKGVTRAELEYFYKEHERYFGDEHRKGVLTKL